jgi:hypothetical protein
MKKLIGKRSGDNCLRTGIIVIPAPNGEKKEEEKMKNSNANDFIKKLLDNNYRVLSETMSLTQWPEDTPKIKVKKHAYCLTQTYIRDKKTVEIFYIFDGFRSPVLPADADRITAYDDSDDKLTILK